MVFWNQRMNALTGNAKYMDVLERSLYNGALDGLSLSGDRFFYGNPLASSGKNARKEWFGTACCPANIARLIASLGDYIYAKDTKGIYINLFVGSETTIQLNKQNVRMNMQTNYPLDGAIQITVSPVAAQNFALHIRKPGWVSNDVVPGDLYKFASNTILQPKLLVNGKPVNTTEKNGYYIIQRIWKKGDVVSYQLPMEIKRVVSKDAIKTNQGRVAIERGPIVYCVEGADNNGKAMNIAIPETAIFQEKPFAVLDEKVVALSAQLPTIQTSADGKNSERIVKEVIAIPYYTWCNRGSNQMQVWLPLNFIDDILKK